MSSVRRHKSCVRKILHLLILHTILLQIISLYLHYYILIIRGILHQKCVSNISVFFFVFPFCSYKNTSQCVKCTLGIFSKRVISAAFPIYCFHFLVVHTVYALRKCHCISKIHLEILRSEDSESTLCIVHFYRVLLFTDI